jgi:Flp pilus assembly protein TadG
MDYEGAGYARLFVRAHFLLPPPQRIGKKDCMSALHLQGVDGQRTKRAGSSRHLGAAVVELACLLPLLMFLFLIATDFARVFYFSLTLTNCARAGALYASDPTAADESAFSSAEAAALADATNISPRPTIRTREGVDSQGREFVEVTAEYPFETITRFPGLPNTIQLSRTVRMFVAAGIPDAT